MAGNGIGEPQAAVTPASLLATLLRRRLPAALLAATRGMASDAHVIIEVPAPVPALATPTRFVYAAACVLMSSMPTLTPLPPGRWQPVQRAPMTFA